MDGMQTTRQTAQTPQQQLSEIRPGRYVIDPVSSAVTFRTRHLFGLGRVRGTFAIRGGAVEVTGVPGEARCYAEIDAASFRTGHPQRDASVRSARLLDTDRNPVITFEARRLDGTDLAGQLTVRGVTRPAAITAELTGAAPGGFTARGTVRVDRTAFGVTAYRGLAARRLDLIVAVRCVAN
jgi:polyisoprenoid-binding protein YceI